MSKNAKTGMSFNDVVQGKQKPMVSFPSGKLDTTEGGIILNAEEKQKMELERQKELHRVKVEETKAYNDKVTELDPMYADMEPVSGVLVRVFATEVPEIEENGLLLMPTGGKVVGETKSGVGTKAWENPFCFSQKAVVVSSSVEKFKPGMIVQLDERAIVPRVVAATEQFVLDYGITHYSYPFAPPIKHEGGKEKHFGYFYVQPNMIQFILK